MQKVWGLDNAEVTGLNLILDPHKTKDFLEVLRNISQ